MAKAFHRDNQDWKSQTSDYSTPRKRIIKASPLQMAQEAELQSGTTLDVIKDRYLDQDEVDMTNEWSSFLDDE